MDNKDWKIPATLVYNFPDLEWKVLNELSVNMAQQLDELITSAFRPTTTDLFGNTLQENQDGTYSVLR